MNRQILNVIWRDEPEAIEDERARRLALEAPARPRVDPAAHERWCRAFCVALALAALAMLVGIVVRG